MIRRFILASALAAGVLGVTLYGQDTKPGGSPTVAFERPDANAKKLHTSFVERAKKGDVDVLFMGDSITQGWGGSGKKVWEENFAKWKPANFGIGGDRTQHVLWRITEGKELEGINPKVVVLMIGTNNVGGNTAEDIAAGVKKIVEEFRKQKPDAKILLLAVFPRSGKPAKDFKDPMVASADELQPKIKQINDIISKLDDGKNVKYLDINAKFLNDKGGLAKSIMPDFLHLSQEGYKIWAEAIVTPVENMLK